MCGIVGYIGRAEAVPILLDGLRRLEYRGYDSAGLATINGGGIEVRKTVGRIADLTSSHLGKSSRMATLALVTRAGLPMVASPTRTLIPISTPVGAWS